MKNVKLVGMNHPDGKEIEITERTFQIDGYNIADRMLEDVMFNVTFDIGGEIINVAVDESSKEYFDQFNQEKFLKMVKKEALINIKGSEEVNISTDMLQKYNINCVWIETKDEESSESKSTPTPMKIGAHLTR